MNRSAFIDPSWTWKLNSPRCPIAETILTAWRTAEAVTTGVCPTGAQVVPEWWSVRTPASSAKKMVAPAAAASAWMAGYSSCLLYTSDAADE